jgi:hypothetical protein
MRPVSGHHHRAIVNFSSPSARTCWPACTVDGHPMRNQREADLVLRESGLTKPVGSRQARAAVFQAFVRFAPQLNFVPGPR